MSNFKDPYKEKRTYPNLWRKACQTAFLYLSNPRAIYRVPDKTVTKAQAEEEAKLVEQYTELHERGKREGWIEWSGGYEGEWEARARREGEPLSFKEEQDMARYNENVSQADAVYKQLVKEAKEVLS